MFGYMCAMSQVMDATGISNKRLTNVQQLGAMPADPAAIPARLAQSAGITFSRVFKFCCS